ncbi:MAG: DNA cytosine methyltransferase [Alphaproteobacteria bacterium]|jgi:DNA (cytosine-5)-methyltransferase 1|nr:DNA cytosine methyltransferase [Alphaproteobacteria bacterium]
MKSIFKKKYKYINLFSGIGCWELGFEKLPMKNILSCEIDNQARKTFKANFSHLPLFKNEYTYYPKDIKQLDADKVPEFDILIASPPCQSFSSAGKRRGLLDKTEDKGNMFFHVLNIVKNKKPKAFILENVKGLLTAEKGRSFKIVSDLFKNAGYDFYYKVLKGSDYGIPQIRQRVFMVGFRKDLNVKNFEFPSPLPLKFTMKDVFKCKEINREIGHTLMARGMHKKYGEPYNWSWYLADGKEKQLGITECKKLMGIPTNFKMPVLEYKQFAQLGNGVIVDIARELGKQVIKYLK